MPIVSSNLADEMLASAALNLIRYVIELRGFSSGRKCPMYEISNTEYGEARKCSSLWARVRTRKNPASKKGHTQRVRFLLWSNGLTGRMGGVEDREGW